MGGFTYLEKFLNRLEEVHSVLDLVFTSKNLTPAKLLTNHDLESKYTPIYLKSNFNTEIKHDEAIFKHSSGLYIYFSREDNSSDFSLKIVYKTELYEEVKIYLNNLKKII